MLYPQKLSSKRKNILVNILLFISIFIAVILTIINKLTTPQTHWAALANGGILYIWVTVLYSIYKNTNIAGHVMIQSIAISLLITYIDYKLEFKRWSLEIAIPIILIIANITMFVLTIVSHRKYIKYAIYQLIICIFSMLPFVLIYENIISYKVLSYIALGISIINFVLTIILCAKDVKAVIVRKFHW